MNNKFLNKLVNVIKSNKKNKRRRKRNKKLTRIPQLSKNPQRLGIGTTIARVTREITLPQGTTGYYDILDNAFAAYEFSRQAHDFNYFKLRCINVIQHPVCVTDVGGRACIYMDWTYDGSSSTTTYGTFDNSKMLSLNSNRPITYTFLPPNARLRRNLSENEIGVSDLPINYCEWVPADQFVAKQGPGVLRMSNSLERNICLTVDVVFLFKGLKGFDPNDVNDTKKYIKFVKYNDNNKYSVDDEIKFLEEKLNELKISKEKQK